MANSPDAEFRESMYPHTTNTPGMVHETTTLWAGVTVGEVGFAAGPSARSALTAGAVDLVERASELAAAYDLLTPTDIRWGRLRQKWGVCHPSGVIEVAAAAANVPGWVLDHIIVHELAHLSFADHGDSFEAMVARYPLSERAAGYLQSIQDREWFGSDVNVRSRSKRRAPL